MRCLRLLCLLSITTDGITQSEVQNIQKLHLHAHGYQHIPLLYKLHTTGLLKYRNEYILHKLPNWSSEWSSNAQKLKMLPSYSKRSDQNSRTCPSYVFNNAYIPAIVCILFFLFYLLISILHIINQAMRNCTILTQYRLTIMLL